MPRGHGKIDDQALFRLLVEERRSQQEAAVHFGVSEAAISKRVRVLNLNLPRHVGLERAAEVADRGLDVIAQLRRMNQAVGAELEWALGEARRPEGNRRALQGVIIDLAAEVGKRLGLQLDVLRALYDVQAVAAFQEELLDAIGQAAPDTRRAILARLAERRALRSDVGLPAAGA